MQALETIDDFSKNHIKQFNLNIDVLPDFIDKILLLVDWTRKPIEC